MSEQTLIKVDSLRPDTSGHNLLVKVIEAKTVLNRPSHPGSKPQKMSECIVGDDTGIILFIARNDQVDMMEPNAWVVMHNAKIDMFKNNMRLAVNQLGKVEPSQDPGWAINVDYNMSAIEYELVHVPSVAAGAMKDEKRSGGGGGGGGEAQEEEEEGEIAEEENEKEEGDDADKE